MYYVTIRFVNGHEHFVAYLNNSETEGVGETIADSLRDLAENIEALQL